MDNYPDTGGHPARLKIETNVQGWTTTLTQGVTFPSGVNVWFASNEEVPVHVNEHDARYWMLHVSPHRFGDTDYWDALHHEIEHGGREAFLHQMLHRDISGFRPQRDVPRKNEALAAAVRGNLDQGDPRLWVEECLETGQFEGVPCASLPTPDEAQGVDRYRMNEVPTWQPWVAGAEISSGYLLAAYREWVSRLRGHGVVTARPTELWKTLSDLGFEVRKTKRGNVRVVPAPEECNLSV